MIIFTKAHPATQAMSGAARPAELNDRYERLLSRRNGGDKAAMAAEDAKFTAMAAEIVRRNPGEPSAAQAESDAYKKPRVEWRGLTIAIENPAGSVRRGTNRHGVSWEIRMRFDYGEIVGSMGVDGDPVDVYMGPNLDAPMVYVVHQRRVNDWANYDEDKCMVGFDCQADAEAAFLSNYNDPRFLGPVTALPVDEFVTKVRATQDKPAMIKALLLKTHISGYTRKDGTVVPPHEDSRAQSLHDDIERQEKWLQQQARDMGYRDIEHLLEEDYPAFERLAAQWREDNPVEVALKAILFFKGFVGPYLRGGKIVNASGYHGRVAHAVRMPGQMSLFGGPESGKPLPPSPLQGKDAVAHTPDMFADADEHGEMPPGRRIMREPQHTEPTRELIAEHERLVDVLNSPSHADDKAEAEKQGAELEEMKREVRTHPTETPQFKRWFDGSKVVDGQGQPIRLYHGTSADFEAFDKKKSGAVWNADKTGFFFSSEPATASEYADFSVSQTNGAANVMPVYVSLKNPLTLEKFTELTNGVGLRQRHGDGVDALTRFFDDERDLLLRYAKQEKNDGILLEKDGKRLVVAFRPEQIKSATGNNGDFDPASPVITKAIVFLRPPAS